MTAISARFHVRTLYIESSPAADLVLLAFKSFFTNGNHTILRCECYSPLKTLQYPVQIVRETFTTLIRVGLVLKNIETCKEIK